MSNFNELHSKQYNIIKRLMELPIGYIDKNNNYQCCTTNYYNNYCENNDNFIRNNYDDKYIRNQYQILDFVYLQIDEGRGNKIFMQNYFGQIIDKYFYNDNCITYEIRLFHNDEIDICSFDLSYILDYIPYDVFQNKINIHIEMREKKIETLKKSTEMVIANITKTKIIIK